MEGDPRRTDGQANRSRKGDRKAVFSIGWTWTVSARRFCRRKDLVCSHQYQQKAAWQAAQQGMGTLDDRRGVVPRGCTHSSDDDSFTSARWRGLSRIEEAWTL